MYSKQSLPPLSLPPLPPRKNIQGAVLPLPSPPNIRRKFLPPLQTLQAEKQRVQLRYTPTPSMTRRAQTIIQRAKRDPSVRLNTMHNTKGFQYINLKGYPSSIRTILGTEEPLIEEPNENFMKEYRRSTLNDPFRNEDMLPLKTKKTMKRKHEPSILRNVLVKSFQEAQQTNRSRRFRNAPILPKTLNFKNTPIQ